MKRREFLKLSAGSAIATVAGTNAGMAQTALPMIKHVVVLMLENRSFDNCLDACIRNRLGSTVWPATNLISISAANVSL